MAQFPISFLPIECRQRTPLSHQQRRVRSNYFWLKGDGIHPVKYVHHEHILDKMEPVHTSLLALRSHAVLRPCGPSNTEIENTEFILLLSLKYTYNGIIVHTQQWTHIPLNLYHGCGAIDRVTSDFFFITDRNKM